jgi:hypothetical protein
MKQDAVVHNFNTSLDKSLRLNDEADWIAFYKRLWPDALTIVRADKYCTVQTRGIDRMIWLPSGKQILIDEKCREKWYGDIALETCSQEVIRNGMKFCRAPGWAVDHAKHCDFVAYAIPSVRRCFMLPFEFTKLALIENLEAWKRDSRCKLVTAKNKDYTTINIGVPWEILRTAITQQMNRKFGSDLVLPPQIQCGTQDGRANQMEFEW